MDWHFDPYTPWAFSPFGSGFTTFGFEEDRESLGPLSYEAKLEAMYAFRDRSDPEYLEGTLKSMNEDIMSITPKWTKSSDRQELVDLLERILPTLDDKAIENALCLGLGSFQTVLPESYGRESCPAGPMYQYYVKNFTFLQLLIFETVIDALKNKFDINSIAFQDPGFSVADRAFLEQRGHTVIPYSASLMAKTTHKHHWPFDQKNLEQYKSASFLFAPCLGPDVLYPALHALAPCLYLGTTLASIITGPLLIDPGSPFASLKEKIVDYAWTRDFEDVLVVGLAHTFHWPGDLSDEHFLPGIQSMVEMWEDEHAEQQAKDHARVLRAQAKYKLTPEQQAEEVLRLKRQDLEWRDFEEKFQAFWRKRAEKEEEEKGHNE